jgi:hypothetical protein
MSQMDQLLRDLAKLQKDMQEMNSRMNQTTSVLSMTVTTVFDSLKTQQDSQISLESSIQSSQQQSIDAIAQLKADNPTLR